MTGKELFIALGDIDLKYYEEAEINAATVHVTRRSIRHPLLIAAIIALMLLLMGCAAIFMSVLFDSPKEMISALYGENTGFDSALPTEVTDPWKPDSAWTVPGYEKQPVEETVSKELEKWVTPVGQSIEAGGNKLTVDAFLYDSVTRSGLITMLLEHSEPLNLVPGHNGLIGEYLVDINQYGYAYMIPEKTTDTQLAFTYYFRMDRRQGDILIVSFPEYEEMARADALEALREEEIPKIRQRIMGELTLEEAAQKCQELYGFSGYTGQYDDYYFLAAYEFDSTHVEESISQYTRDLSTIEQSLKNDLTPEEAVAKLKELWGEELMEETMSGREQEEIEVLAYAILAERIYDQTYYYLSVYTIQDGEVKDVAGGISHILEGGILESSDEHAPGNINRAFYEFYWYTEDGGQMIEKIMYEPDGYWARQENGKDGRAVQEEEALSVINAYKAKRIELDMKPFSEYPMK